MPFRDQWTIDPEIHFLNHGSFGGCPKAVLDRQAELRARMERQPVRFLARDLEGLLDDARAALATFVGADPDDVAFVPNATSGFNAVLRSLSFELGDELLVTNHGYNAARTTAEYVCGRHGVKLVTAQVPWPTAHEDQVVDAILAAVTDTTRLALIDHVTSPTGLVFPIARIVAALKERGVETLVDGAHAPGMLPLDLDALGAAYFTGNCHKWLCAPKGAAFLHVRRDQQAGLRPLVISHGANATRTDRSRFWLEFDWAGTSDPTAFLCVPTAIETLGGLLPGGWPALRERNRALVIEGRALVAEALGTALPAPESMLGFLGAVLVPELEGIGPHPGSVLALDPLQKLLMERAQVEVPVFFFGGGRVLRVSAHIYNERPEYEALAAALRDLRA